jgi:hypothetical protein
MHFSKPFLSPFFQKMKNFLATNSIHPPPAWTVTKSLYQPYTMDQVADTMTHKLEMQPLTQEGLDLEPSRCCCTTCPQCWPAWQQDMTSDFPMSCRFIQSYIPTSKKYFLFITAVRGTQNTRFSQPTSNRQL